MTSTDLIDLLKVLDEASIEVWLDGGWGVDALLKTQTRRHKDVDLIVRVSDVPRLRDVLGRRGFTVGNGSPPHSFVLVDGSKREVDVHAVVFDEKGNGIYRMENGEDWIYPAEGFDGHGSIDGVDVRCLSPEAQVLCHAHGYTPVEKDFQDMAHLHRRFDVDLPPQLKQP